MRKKRENDGMKTNVRIGLLHFCSSILLDEWNNMYSGKVHTRMYTMFKQMAYSASRY